MNGCEEIIRTVLFERFADDAIIHCASELQANLVKKQLEERLKECGLEMHAEKTKIVYCKDSNRTGDYRSVQFDFLGYTFKPRMAQNSIRKVWFTNCLPAVSDKSMRSMREKMRKWTTLKTAGCEIEEVAAEINPVIRGWINYYGKFYISKLINFMQAINYRIVKWVRSKYLKVRASEIKGLRWLKGVSLKQPELFAHWTIGAVPSVG